MSFKVTEGHLFQHQREKPTMAGLFAYTSLCHVISGFIELKVVELGPTLCSMTCKSSPVIEFCPWRSLSDVTGILLNQSMQT